MNTETWSRHNLFNTRIQHAPHSVNFLHNHALEQEWELDSNIAPKIPRLRREAKDLMTARVLLCRSSSRSREKRSFLTS